MTKAERQAKADAKQRHARIRELRAHRKGWLSGALLPWGWPRCTGPKSPYHQHPVFPLMPDGTPIEICEGCSGEAWIRDQVAEIDAEIKALLEPPAPAPAPVQASLF